MIIVVLEELCITVDHIRAIEIKRIVTRPTGFDQGRDFIGRIDVHQPVNVLDPDGCDHLRHHRRGCGEDEKD